MAVVNLLTAADRDGEIVTPSYQIPDTLIGDEARFRVLLADVDLRDPSLEFYLSLLVSEDGSKWRTRAGMSCIGRDEDWEEPPSLGVPISHVKGVYVQTRITVNRSVRIGLEFEDVGGAAIAAIG